MIVRVVCSLLALAVLAAPRLAGAGFEFMDDSDQMAVLGVPDCPSSLCISATITADGRYVNFVTDYAGLSGGIRVRFDRQTETTSLPVDVSSFAATYPFITDISDDDRFVAFESDDDSLVGGDTNGIRDAFIRDRTLGLIERVSVNSSGQQALGDFFGSEQGTASADGRYVVFQSTASNLTFNDTNNSFDVFVRDRVTGNTELISADPSGNVSPNGAQLAFPGFLHSARTMSADGRYVVFEGGCDLLASGCPAGQTDAILIRDRMLGVTSLVSKDPSGEPRFGQEAAISGDGTHVVYVSAIGDIVPGDTNGACDFFIYDRTSDTTTRVPLDGAGNPCNDEPTVTNDGRHVVFGQGDGVVLWADCAALGPVCGDGNREEACEDCDDGNLVDGDGCDSNCTITGCGNGIVTAGEQCDDGNFLDGDGCDSNCTPTACGNGIRTAGEACEDGNTTSGDGCSSTCAVEPAELTSGGASKTDCLQEFMPLPAPPKPDGVFRVDQMTCTDDDPSCDFGAAPGDHQCRFRVAFCANVVDPRLACTPSDVATIEIVKPKLDERRPVDLNNHNAVAHALEDIAFEQAYCTKPPDKTTTTCLSDDDCGDGGKCGKLVVAPMPPLATANFCTHYADIDVPLKLTKGVYSAGKTQIALKVSTSPGASGKARKDSDKLTLVCNP